VCGYLSLSDKTSKYLLSLRDSKFGNVTLLNLGTHTPGGLPLQVPDKIGNNDQLLQYFKDWRPTYDAGTYRTYTNLGIGLLGLITAKSRGQDFVGLMDGHLFPALGIRDSYINIPEGRMADYAQGYTKEDTPIRMTTGVLSSEAYGIRATAADVIRFVEANMNEIEVDEKLRQGNAHRLLQGRADDSGPDLGTVPVSGDLEDAVRRERAGNYLQCNAGYAVKPP